jgi:hypothetical protein
VVIFEVVEEGGGRAKGDREESIDECRVMIGDF